MQFRKSVNIKLRRCGDGRLGKMEKVKTVL